MPTFPSMRAPRRPSRAALAALLPALTLAALAAAPAHAAEPKPAVAGASGKAPAKPMVLPFIEDDYEKALAEARAKRVPLVIDAWAPW
jgi:hypothetical protein